MTSFNQSEYFLCIAYYYEKIVCDLGSKLLTQAILRI